ncbi:hypothetical protein [Peribacillus frigoritolerans]|uniref:hypothetical protein n=1 Tax=Peribacillus frigoritolerans TaxID=450367 RepID=UPI003B8C9E72
MYRTIERWIKVDGIIDDMDEERVTMLVPEEFDEEQENRQYGYGDEYDDYGRPLSRRYPYYYPI